MAHTAGSEAVQNSLFCEQVAVWGLAFDVWTGLYFGLGLGFGVLAWLGLGLSLGSELLLGLERFGFGLGLRFEFGLRLVRFGLGLGWFGLVI